MVCLVAWPLNESEAGGDFVLVETFLVVLCKFLLISSHENVIYRKIKGQANLEEYENDVLNQQLSQF